MIEILICGVLGLGGLLVGGTILIPGVVCLAERLGLPAAAVAVIVIAGGTSAPELIVSVDAALVGSPGIVWGNLIGSNIANIALVLGLGMLVQPVHADATSRSQLILLGGVTLMVWGISAAGGLTGLAGQLMSAGLIVIFAAYLFWLLRHSGRHSDQHSDQPGPDHSQQIMPADMPVLKAGLYALGGVICLVAGADAFVWSGAALARAYGWPEDVIGMSIIAVGTSLPEIMSVLASLRHQRGDIALGSVVGSNLFNFTLVLGAAGLSAGLPASDFTGWTLMPVLIAITALLIGCAVIKKPLGRRSGVVFVGFYLAFLGLHLAMYNA